MRLFSNISSFRKGLFYALLAYTVWGIFPLYWKLLEHVPSEQILAHRIVWSFVFMGLLLFAYRDRNLLQYLKNLRILGLLLITSLLIGGNWFTYIYAVNHDHILDASLGYYINPLVNVLLGTLFLKEKLNKLQWAALAFAFGGLGYLTWHLGSLPVISLFLAGSFGIYGLLRKKANLQSMPGLFIETLLLTPVALFYLWTIHSAGQGSFGNSGALSTWLLVLAGPGTALPLMWFGSAAVRLPLTTLGFTQYLSPTLQFLIGLFLFHEPFSRHIFISFLLVWIGLVMYTIQLVRKLRAQ